MCGGSWNDSSIRWLIRVCDMTHLRLHAWHDSLAFACVTRLTRRSDTTHSLMIHLGDMPHSYMCHASFIYVPCLIHMCAMPYSYVSHDSFDVWHDSYTFVNFKTRDQECCAKEKTGAPFFECCAKKYYVCVRQRGPEGPKKKSKQQIVQKKYTEKKAQRNHLSMIFSVCSSAHSGELHSPMAPWNLSVDVCTYSYRYTKKSTLSLCNIHMGWLRLRGSLKLQVSFAE